MKGCSSITFCIKARKPDTETLGKVNVVFGDRVLTNLNFFHNLFSDGQKFYENYENDSIGQYRFKENVQMTLQVLRENCHLTIRCRWGGNRQGHGEKNIRGRFALTECDFALCQILFDSRSKRARNLVALDLIVTTGSYSDFFKKIVTGDESFLPSIPVLKSICCLSHRNFAKPNNIISFVWRPC